MLGFLNNFLWENMEIWSATQKVLDIVSLK